MCKYVLWTKTFFYNIFEQRAEGYYITVYTLSEILYKNVIGAQNMFIYFWSINLSKRDLIGWLQHLSEVFSWLLISLMNHLPENAPHTSNHTLLSHESEM